MSWFFKEIPCIPKDSDTCIQNAETWDSEYVCANLQQGKPDHEYCDSYSKDAKRCCPDACGNTEDFTESVCKASSGSGKCKYPNEAQCSEIYIILIYILEGNSWLKSSMNQRNLFIETGRRLNLI